jgi:hypothetical protein
LELSKVAKPGSCFDNVQLTIQFKGAVCFPQVVGEVGTYQGKREDGDIEFASVQSEFRERLCQYELSNKLLDLMVEKDLGPQIYSEIQNSKSINACLLNPLYLHHK